ncbi:MAG TPA: DEAD/DEAH box helicase, partial [Trebonia sp.]
MPTGKSAITPAGSPQAARRQRRGQHRELVPVTDVTFADLGVPAPLVAALAETGITVPFPVQAATLPDALAGHDILGGARTGSGKTLGFCLPLAARLADGYTLACRP